MFYYGLSMQLKLYSFLSAALVSLANDHIVRECVMVETDESSQAEGITLLQMDD